MDERVAPAVERCSRMAYKVTDIHSWSYDQIEKTRTPPWLSTKAALSEATIIFIGAGGVALTQQCLMSGATVSLYAAAIPLAASQLVSLRVSF